MPLAYSMHEGGEWYMAYPDVPADWSSMLYEGGWVYDRVLERLGYSPWRHMNWWVN